MKINHTYRDVDDQRWMRIALSLAARGLGRVAPNPAVGCIIVKCGRIIGRGITATGGRPHAETGALMQAGDSAATATAYVTLEPCAHHAKTPPCAQALIDAKIARVVSAIRDPDTRVSGGGHSLLRNHGIDIKTNVLATEARRLNLGFFKRIEQDLPLLTLKMAGSIDGRIATKTGESRWISSGKSRNFVHLLRAQHDGVLIGAASANADNADLQVRLHKLQHHSPVRIILDTRLKNLAYKKMLNTAHQTPVWIYHAKNTPPSLLKKRGITLIQVPCNSEQRLSLHHVMRDLARRGMTRILCEGGGILAGNLLRAGLVDRLVSFHAGCAIGSDGQALLGCLNVKKLQYAPKFHLQKLCKSGNDIMAHWDVGALQNQL